MSHRKKNFRYKPGERDHITIVGEDDTGRQIHECGVCGGRWSSSYAPKARKRFAFQHWMLQHIKCAKEQTNV